MMTTVGLIWGEDASGADTSESRDGSGNSGRMRVRNHLTGKGKHQKEPELRRTPWGRRDGASEREGWSLEEGGSASG